MSIIDITTSRPGTYLGIRQIRDNSLSVPKYEYSEPRISLMSMGNQGRTFTFNSCSVSISLSDGPTLPVQIYPLTPFKVSKEPKDVTLEILRLHKTLLETLYPGGMGAIAQEGIAELVLKGVDENGNPFELPMTLPLAFQASQEP